MIAGRNLTIESAQNSNIRATGSTIAAGNTVNLAADNAITLEASQDTFASVGRNTSSGMSVGVGFAAGAQNGITIDLGVTRGRGSDHQNWLRLQIKAQPLGVVH